MRRSKVPDIALIVLAQSSQALVLGGVALFLPLICHDLGPRRLFVCGLLGVDVLALTFSLLHHYELMVANQALSGFVRSLVFAPGMLLIAALLRPQRRATALGLFVAGGSPATSSSTCWGRCWSRAWAGAGCSPRSRGSG